VHGGLLVIKPPGMTSHDVVEYVRGLCEGKVGHTGTLDPAAAGLLVLCLGAATRLSEYLLNCDKTYRAEITFGITTTTADAEGEISNQQPASYLTATQVEDAIGRLTGPLQMTVPIYSAVSQGGVRLYEYAAQDKDIQLPTRAVEIYRWELLDFAGAQHPTALTEVKCSKGTYVRSLAEMLGHELGTGAYLSFLVRTQVGPHRLEDAHTLAQIAAAAQDGTVDELLRPPLAMVSHLPQIQIDEALVSQLRNGGPVPLASSSDYSGPVAVISDDQALLAIAEPTQRQEQQWLRPRKVFDWST